jgi:hypothetical protein
MERNRYISLRVSEGGRDYIESLANDYHLGISDVIRVALAYAQEHGSAFENRLAQIGTKF